MVSGRTFDIHKTQPTGKPADQTHGQNLLRLTILRCTSVLEKNEPQTMPKQRQAQ